MIFYYITYTNGEAVFVIKRPAEMVGDAVNDIIREGEKLICVALVPQPSLP